MLSCRTQRTCMRYGPTNPCPHFPSLAPRDAATGEPACAAQWHMIVGSCITRHYRLTTIPKCAGEGGRRHGGICWTMRQGGRNHSTFLDHKATDSCRLLKRWLGMSAISNRQRKALDLFAHIPRAPKRFTRALTRAPAWLARAGGLVNVTALPTQTLTRRRHGTDAAPFPTRNVAFGIRVNTLRTGCHDVVPP